MSFSMIDPAVRVGHIHLRVADLARAAAFYHSVIGLAVTIDGREFGLPAVFLAAGDYHHHIALNTFESAGGTPPPPGHSGLHHLALVYPGPQALATAARRLLAYGWPVDSVEDHGGTVSIYLRDPDGNGVELYYDRPQSEWFDAQGRLLVKAEPIDLHAWLAEVDGVRDAFLPW